MLWSRKEWTASVRAIKQKEKGKGEKDGSSQDRQAMNDDEVKKGGLVISDER